jgi:hypothetical protein
MESRSSYQKKAWWTTRPIYIASQPSHQFSYEPINPYHNIEYITVAYNGWNSFQPRYDLQQAPLGRQYSANSIYPPRQVMDDQSFSGLSQDTIIKIEELNRLMNKYPKYHINPNVIIQWAIHSSFNGDNKFLDDKLEQLRHIDSLANVKF